MTSKRGLLVRERIDVARISAANAHERCYITQLVKRTVMEEPRARWSADELLNGIDWAIQKIEEHRAENPYQVLHDSFGTQQQFNNSASRSATSPPQGNPPSVNVVAQSFQTGPTAATLDRLEMALSKRTASGAVRVDLCSDTIEGPGQPIMSWPINVEATTTTGRISAIVVLRPDVDVALKPDTEYWICLATTASDTDVPWWSGDPMLVALSTKIGELNDQAPWRISVASGPGFALKVTGAPESAGQPARLAGF